MPAHLSDHRPLFVGVKLDGTMRRTLRALGGADRRYVSDHDPSFLMFCRRGQDEYVGKRIDDVLTTDRVDDVRRNVLSILSRICPDIRFPQHLEILTWEAGPETDADPGDERA
jgi:hypothetical protein